MRILGDFDFHCPLADLSVNKYDDDFVGIHLNNFIWCYS